MSNIDPARFASLLKVVEKFTKLHYDNLITNSTQGGVLYGD